MPQTIYIGINGNTLTYDKLTPEQLTEVKKILGVGTASNNDTRLDLPYAQHLNNKINKTIEYLRPMAELMTFGQKTTDANQIAELRKQSLDTRTTGLSYYRNEEF